MSSRSAPTTNHLPPTPGPFASPAALSPAKYRGRRGRRSHRAGLADARDAPGAELESGQYTSELWGGTYDRVQIMTVAELLEGKKPNVAQSRSSAL